MKKLVIMYAFLRVTGMHGATEIAQEPTSPIFSQVSTVQPVPPLPPAPTPKIGPTIPKEELEQMAEEKSALKKNMDEITHDMAQDVAQRLEDKVKARGG